MCSSVISSAAGRAWLLGLVIAGYGSGCVDIELPENVRCYGKGEQDWQPCPDGYVCACVANNPDLYPSYYCIPDNGPDASNPMLCEVDAGMRRTEEGPELGDRWILLQWAARSSEWPAFRESLGVPTRNRNSGQ